MERAWHQSQPYDIVILDQMMPGLSGDELAGRIRAHKFLSDTRLVIASSVGRDFIRAWDNLKLDAVLEKPVRHQELLDTLVNIYGIPGALPLPRDSRRRAPKLTLVNPAKVQAKLRILLAEDNKINQQYASVVLNKAGYHVTIAENGRQAVEAVRTRRFRPGADGHPDARTGWGGSHAPDPRSACAAECGADLRHDRPCHARRAARNIWAPA